MKKILKIYELQDIIINSLVNIYERFKNIDLGRIPDHFNPESNTFKLKLKFDHAFLNTFQIDVDDQTLRELYHEIHQSINQWIGN